ncbi:glycosyltransferase [Actinomycetospora rhizophila]|uniref:Glycosyltransferase n=1 Tax=Actinomycetospora rhizophila TaxID=1416876 RepID=A0ABV9ZB73_9PSEU
MLGRGTRRRRPTGPPGRPRCGRARRRRDRVVPARRQRRDQLRAPGRRPPAAPRPHGHGHRPRGGAGRGAGSAARPGGARPGARRARRRLAAGRRADPGGARGAHGVRPDVVHLASPFVLGARALTVARRLQVPAVAVYQTDVAGFASSYGVGLTARAAWRWIRRLHSGAARTLAPSRWAVDALESHGVPRVHRWGRGVDTTRFHPDRRDDGLRAELAPHGELLVGYVGRLAPEKQVERLAALEGLPGVRVVVVGDGPSRARLAELLPSARFLGFRGGAELARAYASFDAFVHTGPHETFCQAVQEAQASGLPVLAPDAGGVADLVDPGRTGWLYDPSSPTAGAEIAGRIAAWRDDPATRRAAGAAGRRRVAGRTWPSVCEELLGHYAAVIAGDETGRAAPVATTPAA